MGRPTFLAVNITTRERPSRALHSMVESRANWGIVIALWLQVSHSGKYEIISQPQSTSQRKPTAVT